MRSKLIFLIIGCLMMAAVANINICNADAVDDAESVISGIVMYKIQESGCENEKEWVDYALPQGAGNDSDAYAYGMAKMSGYDLREYTKALKEYLSEHEVKSASTRLKYALCLIPGAPEDPFITEAAENSVGQLGIMSLVFGLHLSNNGYESDTYPAERIIGEIDALRHEDGGWSVMGQYGDVDVTAMVLQAFAGYVYSGKNEALNIVHAAVSEGLRFLSEKQHEDGGYAGFGADNAESTAQVLLALSDLGIDAEQDDRFIKNGKSIFDGLDRYRLSDGSYSHTEGAESNPTATMQVFTAMVAYKGMKDGRAPYYVYDREDQIDTDAPDSVGEKDRNGDAGGSREEQKDNSDIKTPGVITEKTDQETTNKEKGISNQPAAANESGKTGEAEGNRRFRLIACSVLGLITLIACVLLFALKKTHYKNFIFILILNLIAVFAIFRVNIQSADNYYSSGSVTEAESIGEITFTIRCDTIAGSTDSEFVPKDGIILKQTTMELHEGESVYDLLVRAVRENGIHMENMKTGAGAHGNYYISGINHIYEYEYGELSGWMYYVNKEAPSVGCGEYFPNDRDEIAWVYTLEIGRDIEW